jgi:hypothetical protein
MLISGGGMNGGGGAASFGGGGTTSGGGGGFLTTSSITLTSIGPLTTSTTLRASPLTIAQAIKMCSSTTAPMPTR